MWLFYAKKTVSTHLRFRFLLNQNIPYVYVYVAVVYIVYNSESGEKQGEMVTTWINYIIENLTVAHLYTYFVYM